MKRLIEKMVFSGLVMAWRLATCPTSRSPLLVNATTDGVVRLAFLIGDDRRLAGFHDGDARVGGAQIDANNFSHLLSASLELVKFYDGVPLFGGAALVQLPLSKLSELLSSFI